MAVSRPTSTALSRPSGDAAPAAPAAPSWTTCTAASATTTLAGSGGATFSDETGEELRATVDLTETTLFNTLANHGGMLVYDTGLTVADEPSVSIRFSISTTPSPGADAYYVVGVIIAATTTPTPASDSSRWAMHLFGPNTEVGTTCHFNILANNANPGTNSNQALAQKTTLFATIMEATLSGAGKLVKNAGTQLQQPNNTTSTTGLTSTDKVLVFVAAGNRDSSGSGTTTVGGKVQYLAAGATA